MPILLRKRDTIEISNKTLQQILFFSATVLGAKFHDQLIVSLYLIE